MLDLIKEYNIETIKVPLYKKNKHHKDFWDGNKRKKPLNQSYVKKYFELIKKLFKYMNEKGNSYCNKYTLEQICLELFSFKDVRFIEFCYGYAAEFRVANSLVGKKNIENELFNSKNIYIFKKGYKSLIESMIKEIKDKIDIKLNHEVLNIEEINNEIILKTNKSKFKCKKLILAIPKQSLMKMKCFLKPKEINLLNNVNSVSLTRLFVQFDMKNPNNQWLKNINFSTVNNPIRQIIPIRRKLGLFQISYSDWYFADYWGNLDNKKIKKILKNLLKETFQYEKIYYFILFKKYYWKDAIHFWKPNVDFKKINKKIMRLRKNIFITGETFSLNQGWCEGSIMNSIKLCKLI